MSYFGQGNEHLVPFGTGPSGVPGLKDYEHAAKTFRSNGYQLSPRNKFLFHVVFNINTAQIPQLLAAYGSGEVASISLMVKSVELPKFKIDTAVMNQYNRKRVVQTKIKYDPSRIIFHDDQSDLIRNMWYNYYTYYYKDPSMPYNGVSAMSGSAGQLQAFANGFSYNANDIYSPVRQRADWGFVGESYLDGTSIGVGGSGKPPFFRDITVYGLSQKTYSAWTMINPIISSWSHDTYDYNEGGGTMQNDMSIEYETVKYYSGAIGSVHPSNVVHGFSDPAHYDTVESGITDSAGPSKVYSQGNLVDAVYGSAQDLQAPNKGYGGLQDVLGGVQTALAVYNKFQPTSFGQQFGFNLNQQATTDLQVGLPPAVQQAVGSGGGMLFPTASTGE